MIKRVYILIATDTEDNTKSVDGVFASKKLAEARLAENISVDDGDGLFTYEIVEDYLIGD